MKGRKLGDDPVKPQQIQGIKMPDKIVSGTKKRSMEDILQEQGLLDEPGSQAGIESTDQAPRASRGAKLTEDQQSAGANSSEQTRNTRATPNTPDQQKHVPVEDVVISPYQPRIVFDPDKLEELADSIATMDLIHPPIVRPVNGKWELIGGERRYRAIKLLGWTSLPVKIVEVDDAAAEIMALVDNTGSEPLTPYEEAKALFRAKESRHGGSLSSLARSMGKNKGTIFKQISYFNLPSKAIAILDETPSLLSQRSAIDLASISGEYPEIVIEAVDAVRTGKLDQMKAVRWAMRKVTSIGAVSKPRSVKRTSTVIDKNRKLAQATISGKKITLVCTNEQVTQEVLDQLIDAFGVTLIEEEGSTQDPRNGEE
ncbi:ParB/RepB/Spo0J family partition protein [Pseudomonas neustonica]|uniref:ParB/RepB/Spo0J family partition protein n=1 Tax=Pseudomonas neustonica TaxID=2487346 RepID=UPI003F44A5B6|tara:strand:- start:25177 stop:26286 length:1110 start_codon:yes stop_codon:yes gene_type:complete